MGDTVYLWEMPRTEDNAEPYMYCVFSYTYTPILKFDL